MPRTAFKKLQPGSIADRMMALLRSHAYTSHEIADRLDVTERVVQAVLTEFRRAKRSRYAGWRLVWVSPSRQAWRPLHRLGSAPDAPKPAPKSNAETSRQWRERRKARLAIPNSVFALHCKVTCDAVTDDV